MSIEATLPSDRAQELVGELHQIDQDLAAADKAVVEIRNEFIALESRRNQLVHKRNLILERFAEAKEAQHG